MEIPYLKIGQILLVILMSSFCRLDAYGQGQSKSAITSSVAQADGMTTITFCTPDGTIDINLPGDMTAGDTISGTIFGAPKGNSAEEFAHYVDELNSYVVELRNAHPVRRRAWSGNAMSTTASSNLSSPVASGRFHNFACRIPDTGDRVQFVLADKKYATLATQDVSYSAPSSKAPVAQEALVVPSEGRSGQMLRIRGPFGGDFSSTKIMIGGENCTILAESPRQLIFVTPKNVTGKSKIELRTGSQFTTVKINIQTVPSAHGADVLDLSGGWSGTPGPITITQSGPFVTWDTGSIRYWGTITKNGLDFEFHNYRYESWGEGHMERKPQIGYKTFWEGYYYKTSVGNKKVDYPRHACSIYR